MDYIELFDYENCSDLYFDLFIEREMGGAMHVSNFSKDEEDKIRACISGIPSFFIDVAYAGMMSTDYTFPINYDLIGLYCTKGPDMSKWFSVFLDKYKSYKKEREE